MRERERERENIPLLPGFHEEKNEIHVVNGMSSLATLFPPTKTHIEIFFSHKIFHSVNEEVKILLCLVFLAMTEVHMYAECHSALFILMDPY